MFHGLLFILKVLVKQLFNLVDYLPSFVLACILILVSICLCIPCFMDCSLFSLL